MLSSVLKGRAFAGTVALPASLRLGWLARHADAITDTLGQPLFPVGRYMRPDVASLRRNSELPLLKGIGDGKAINMVLLRSTDPKKFRGFLLRRSNMFIALGFLIYSAPLGAACKRNAPKHMALRWSA